MLKLVTGSTLILGVEQKNIDRMQQGKPIHISAEVNGVKYALTAGIERIIIFYAETPAALIDELIPIFPELEQHREALLKQIEKGAFIS